MKAGGVGATQGSLRDGTQPSVEGKTNKGDNDPSHDILSKTQTSSIYGGTKGTVIGGARPPFIADKLWTKQAQRAGRTNYSSIDDEMSKLLSNNVGST